MKVSGLFRIADATREYSAGEVVFREGDDGTEMFGIVHGAVELTRRGDVIATLGVDDVFGEMAIIDSSARMATATVTEPTQVAVIDRRQFLYLVHETPMFALQVMSAMADRLRHEA